MYDISDITFDIKDGRSRKELVLRLKGLSDLNLIKVALALRSIVDKIEDELGIMAEAVGEH